MPLRNVHKSINKQTNRHRSCTIFPTYNTKTLQSSDSDFQNMEMLTLDDVLRNNFIMGILYFIILSDSYKSSSL